MTKNQAALYRGTCKQLDYIKRLSNIEKRTLTITGLNTNHPQFVLNLVSELKKSGVIKWSNYNNNVERTQSLNYNMAKITFMDQRAADRAYISRPTDQRVEMHIERSIPTMYRTKYRSSTQSSPSERSGVQGHW